MEPQVSSNQMATKERKRKRRHVDTTGISLEEQRLRNLIFSGVSPETAAKKCGLSVRRAEKVLRELERAGCGPGTEGPYTTEQAAIVLGLKLRRTRTLAEEGRIGQKHGRWFYLFSRADLEEFGARERRSGHPGKVARAEELSQANGHANGAAK